MGKKSTITTGSLSALAFCFGAGNAAHADNLRLQNLEVSQESKMSYEEFKKLASARPNAETFGSGPTTSGNYSDVITEANYSNVVTAANYSDVVTAGNYANVITEGNYGQVTENDAAAEQLPAPHLAE